MTDADQGTVRGVLSGGRIQVNLVKRIGSTMRFVWSPALLERIGGTHVVGPTKDRAWPRASGSTVDGGPSRARHLEE